MLGFEIQEASEGGFKTVSEELFEQYLESSGMTDYRYQPELPGTSRRPDYELVVPGQRILFEVKEFQATARDFSIGGGSFDAYVHIREKIGAGRKKFKDLEGNCCCLVLYNHYKPLVILDWRFIYGAMLGNIAFRMPFSSDTGAPMDTEMKLVFAGGGEIVRYPGARPQNTTISAVIVLSQFPIGQRRFNVEVRRRELALGRELTWEEFWSVMQGVKGTELDLSLRQIRLVVHENPDALVRLPEELFRSPYDERYGLKEGRIQSLYVGEQIEKLKELEKEVG